MIFLTFSNRWAVFAVALFSLLLCASAPAEDYVPLEDVTKLERPTICISRGDGFYLIDWDGQNERLWMAGRFNLSARFSRDGKYASFIATGGYKHYILELETGRLINMVEWREHNGYDHISISGAWWFPDGRRLACRGKDLNSPNLSQADIFLLDLRKETIVNLTETLFKDEIWATVSADGKKIAFSGYPPSEQERAALGITHYPDHLYTMSPDGRNVVNLTNSHASYSYPEWSPDGKKIAIQVGGRLKEGEEPIPYGIFTIDPDGSNLERLTSPKDGFGADIEDWSADSKWVLYSMKEEDELGSPWSLYRIHIETREIVRIRTPSATARWVHAGKSRFLSVDTADKKKAQWGKIKAAGGNENSPAPQERNSLGEE